VPKDAPINFTNIDSPYGADSELARTIEQRGIEPSAAQVQDRVVSMPGRT
jgi:hypothetical protein